MRVCGIVLCVLWTLSFCVAAGCNRRRGTVTPSAADEKAFAKTVVGSYTLKPNSSSQLYSPEPKIRLLPGGTIVMESIPSEWVSGFAAPSEFAFTTSGTWKVGDDGDGSWEIFVEVADLTNGSQPKRLRLRPFSQPEAGVMFDSPNTHGPNLFRMSDAERGVK